MKKLVRLTEGDLHRIVKKSVQRIVSEASATPNGFKHRFGTNKRDRDFPLEQPNRMSEGQLHQIVKESVRQMLSELDWKTYANAAKKRYSQGNFDKFHDLRSASEDAFNKKYGYNDEWDADLQHGGERKVYMQGTGENYSEPTLRASKNDRYPSLYGAFKSVGSTLSHNKKGDYVYGGHHQSCDDGHWSSNNADDFDFGPDEVFRGAYGAAKREFDRYDNDNYEYEPNGRGWHLKDNMDEAIRRAIRKALR